MPASSDGVLTATARPYAAVGIDVDWSPMWPGGVDRVNLIPTASLPVSTWAPANGASVAASGSVAFDGSSSTMITWGTSAALGQGVYRNAVPVTAGKSHTASVALYVPGGGSTAAAPAIRVAGVATGNAVTVGEQWVISTVTWTPTGSTADIVITPTAAATAGWRVYADCASVEATASALSPRVSADSPGVLDVGPNLVLPVPWRTTVTRTIGSETVTVRSGDRAATPGGAGYVQDNEAIPGVAHTYRAYGYSGTGALLATSTSVAITPTAVTQAWLKSVDNPHLNQPVRLVDLQYRMGQTVEVFPIDGQPPVVWGLGQTGYRGALTVRVSSKAEHDAVLALAASGVLYLSGANRHAIPGSGGIYVRATSDSDIYRPPTMPGWSFRRITLSWVQVARPDTAGSPLMVPGWSYGVRDAAYSTYAAADAAYPSYRALAKGP